MPEVCRLCKKPSTTRCGRCAEAYYCGKECQTAHWKEHKKVCASIAEIKALRVGDVLEDAQTNEQVERAIDAAAKIGGVAYNKVDGEMRVRLARMQQQGADISSVLLQQQLSTAAGEGDLDAVRHLLQQAVPVDPPMSFCVKPLHSAARAGQSSACRLLLEYGALVDTRDNKGMTPLHLAVAYGCSETYLRTVLALGFAGARFDSIVGAPPGVYALPPPPGSPAVLPLHSLSTAAAAAASLSALSSTSTSAGAGRGAAGESADAAGTGPVAEPVTAEDKDAAEARARAAAWSARDAIAGRTLLHLAASSDSSPTGVLMRAVILGCAGRLRGAMGLADADPSVIAKAPLPKLSPSLIDALDPDGQTALTYAAAHAHAAAVRALLEAGACPHGRLAPSTILSIASDPAAAYSAPGIDMPITALLETYAAAVGEQEACLGAAEVEKDEEAVKRELLASSAAAGATQERVLDAARALFAAGAVLPSGADCPAEDVENIPWEEAGIDAEAGGAEGGPLLLPRLAVACSNPSYAPFVAVALEAGRALPSALASDGKTTPLHVACMALNEGGVDSLVKSIGGASGSGGKGDIAQGDSAVSLAKCIDAGLAWAAATAAETSPGLAREAVAAAKARAGRIRALLGMEQQGPGGKTA